MKIWNEMKISEIENERNANEKKQQRKTMKRKKWK